MNVSGRTDLNIARFKGFAGSGALEPCPAEGRLELQSPRPPAGSSLKTTFQLQNNQRKGSLLENSAEGETCSFSGRKLSTAFPAIWSKLKFSVLWNTEGWNEGFPSPDTQLCGISERKGLCRTAFSAQLYKTAPIQKNWQWIFNVLPCDLYVWKSMWLCNY